MHNHREITPPHILEEWKDLRFYDFKKVNEYNSAILRIVSQLIYCGKPVTESERLERTSWKRIVNFSFKTMLYENNVACLA